MTKGETIDGECLAGLSQLLVAVLKRVQQVLVHSTQGYRHLHGVHPALDAARLFMPDAGRDQERPDLSPFLYFGMLVCTPARFRRPE